MKNQIEEPTEVSVKELEGCKVELLNGQKVTIEHVFLKDGTAILLLSNGRWRTHLDDEMVQISNGND